MTDDRHRLEELLRAAMPAANDRGPARDLWPALADRVDEAPRWSYVDLSLAAAVVVALVTFPELIWLVAYHL